jgi:hypothetical protein
MYAYVCLMRRALLWRTNLSVTTSQLLNFILLLHSELVQLLLTS